jgi:signal transduction histidine kinase
VNPKDKIVASLQTAQAELEKALGHLAHLPGFDASRARFLGHLLSNYLTVTIACTDLLQKRLNDHPDEQVHIWLKGLRHSTGLMTNAALQLMNVPVTEGEQMILEKVDLPTLVRRACDYYQRVAEKKQITINFNEPRMLSSNVWVDRVAVAAVLDNLLSNAIKFSPPHKRVWVSVTDEPAHLVCTVRDEGPGLSTEDQAKLFQRGVLLSNKPTGGEASAAYGLAVAKELIEKLHAEIWCESQPGQGASFSFRLPIYSEEQHGTAGQ